MSEPATCAECGVTFAANGRQTMFCSPACSRTWKARTLRRGQISQPFVQAAALARHAPCTEGRYATRQLWALAARWNEENRRAGRLNALQYAKRRMESHWQACDLD